MSNVGSGASQVLPMGASLLAEDSIIMEQPEIHLYPEAQSSLANLILNASKARKLQIVIKSLSKYLLRRLQNRVAKGKDCANDLTIYSSKIRNGLAQFQNLELNKWGEIVNRPKNIFGDEVGEVSAIMKEGVTRKAGSLVYD
ncbi:MAG: hypothetical protein OXD01_10125 [Gammaproteobacteria bacterium]|nr:hypothetical protein [Gammaproteobacteria bacterium]